MVLQHSLVGKSLFLACRLQLGVYSSNKHCTISPTSEVHLDTTLAELFPQSPVIIMIHEYV